MNEPDYWLHLAYRLCDEMRGIEECRRAGLWCDGILPDLAQADPTRICGEAWIFGGRNQETLWRFTLVLPQRTPPDAPIAWAELLPAEDVTGWLSLDFEAKRIGIDPAAAIADAEVPESLPSDETHILGIVHARGAGGGSTPPAWQWTLKFVLQPWRVRGGPLRQSPIELRREVEQAELRRMMDVIRPYDMIEVVARGTVAAAELLRLADVRPEDLELQRAAAALQVPLHVEDPEFGSLTFDRRHDWFACRADWCGRRVMLTLEAGNDERLHASLTTARALWRDPSVWAACIEEFAVQRLLDLKNEAWLEPDEARIPAQTFRACMVLESVSAAPDGRFEFWYADGDLFWGHAILVAGTLADGPTLADVVG